MKYITIAALALLAACGTPNSGGTSTTIDQYKRVPVILGAQPVDVFGTLKNRGFSVKTLYGEMGISWTCRSEEPGITYVAEVHGPALQELSYVRATVITDGITDASNGVAFLAFVASLQYDGADPGGARAWVEQHGNTDGAHMDFGPVNFTISAPTNASRILLISPSIAG